MCCNGMLFLQYPNCSLARPRWRQACANTSFRIHVRLLQSYTLIHMSCDFKL